VISEYDPRWPELFCEPDVRHSASRRTCPSTTCTCAWRAGYTEAKTTFIEGVLAGG
jgi:hypothetical protein